MKRISETIESVLFTRSELVLNMVDGEIIRIVGLTPQEKSLFLFSENLDIALEQLLSRAEKENHISAIRAR